MLHLRLENLVHLAVCAQLMLAALLLGIGESNFLVPLLSLAMLCISLWVTDLKKWFYLQQPRADAAAVAVVGLSAWLAVRADRQELLTVVANLQAYLQYVLLFQRKSPRIYWQLALLSLGQVAIASTLVPGPTFGFMLLAYLATGILSFALLLLDGEATRVSLRRPAANCWSPVLVGSAATVEPKRALLRLMLPVTLVIGLAVLVGGPVFFMLPRWNVSSIEIDSEPLRTVGFSNTVLLGELGEVVNNPDLVMRIQFFRGIGSRPLMLEGEPLLRGAVVTRYEDRTWRHSLRPSPVSLPTEPRSTIVRQRITIEPLDVRELFCIFPVYAIGPPDPRLNVDSSSSQLIRREEYRTQQLEVEVGTTGITGNRQRKLVPREAPMSELEMRRLTEIAPEGFAGLTELAGSVLAEKGIDPKRDTVAAARALSNYFRDSGQFFYSLDPQVRDENLDPLEDFVTLHRGGHCEYFAGALVLMLRSQGIPARMAIGFKGGEWNPLGEYYQIQQLHAHAWVEAFIGRDQVPEDELDADLARRGAWLILDPTEGIQEGLAAQRQAGIVARLRQTIDYGRVLWINYVASLNSKRQRQGIYEPLLAGLDAGLAHLASVEVWQERLKAFDNSRLGKFWRWYRRHWFSWRGGLVAIGFSLVGVGSFVALRKLVRRLLGRDNLARRGHADGPPVLEMYRRLESALARQGLARGSAQTPYEFALAAGGEMAERLEHRRLAHLPRRIVESFYRVRFGGRTLDNQEAEAVEHALNELERAPARTQL